MSNKAKTDAEVRYAKAQKRAQDATEAQNEAAAEAKRVDEKTERLRALRLAKEEADRVAKAAEPPKKKAKPRAKKKAAAIPVEDLNASNDD
ncbi:hypothetical protein [Bauldia litoralis]|uniref:Uncharacterized protein n=1 Tax=Bauldia litoralis TaxID=665467 RepID=A0A1G6BZV0_9HYPH|nr:hypothetical protein [Bauldia litoralis]SDB26125.1 hypothetical protein SAMN02982931_02055 [Bauldia litoralis]